MTLKKKVLVIAASIAVLCSFGTAVVFKLNSPSGSSSDYATTPLGGLFGRATAVSRLKDFMGDLRGAYPAMTKFAETHQDELPATVAELRPYLPPKLARLDDEHWELPSRGKMTPLVTTTNANNQILLQEKNTPAGKPKIIMYADGHIEYSAKRE